MKFTISSVELLNHLQIAGKVINNKNTLPILDNFLFELNDETIKVTSSDGGSMLESVIPCHTIDGEGKIAVPAKILMDTLKEFPDQPITFDINEETLLISIISENGEYKLVGVNPESYPTIENKGENINTIEVEPTMLLSGINKTLFAIAEDELRPVLNGIFFDISPEGLTLATTDTHKLVRYRRNDVENIYEASSFILAKKPATILKNILPKIEENIKIEFDEKNAFFSLGGFKLVCRLIEGKYPNYSSVITRNNPNIITVNRLDFLNSLKRVSVFANSNSNLVKLSISNNKIELSAQDIDFAISGREEIICEFEGDPIDIGFKSTFLIEIVSVLDSANINIELTDSSRSGIFVPYDGEDTQEDTLMLLMPMMIK